MNNKKLILVGAGPGSPDLITVRGLNALKEAQVILFDALVHPELLNLAPADSLKIFVGKRSGQHSMTQDEINQLIVSSIYHFGSAVRLKGGDPFIFGRGYEEIEYVKKFGIETEVIPGVSSSTGLTALQQIPLTSRGMNDGFWVITGSTSEQKLSEDILTASKTNATVVVLMGFKKLSKIVEAYQLIGKHDLPVAIIQNGSFEDEKIALGTVDTILQKAEKLELGTPAVIVLGEVVKLHPEFQKNIKDKKVFKEKQLPKETLQWISKEEWTIKSGLPEPPGILPVEHLMKLRFRRAVKSFIKMRKEASEKY